MLYSKRGLVQNTNVQCDETTIKKLFYRKKNHVKPWVRDNVAHAVNLARLTVLNCATGGGRVVGQIDTSGKV